MTIDLEPRTARAVADRTAARRSGWLRELDGLLGGELDDAGIDRVVELLGRLGRSAGPADVAALKADRAASVTHADALGQIPAAVRAMTAARDVFRALEKRLGSELKALRQRIERLHEDESEGRAARRAASAVSELARVAKINEPGAIRWKCLMGSA